MDRPGLAMSPAPPYAAIAHADWPEETGRRLARHPLRPESILAAARTVLSGDYPLARLSKELGEIEFALDHGMRTKNLPHRFKGAEKGGLAFLARALAKEVARPDRQSWRLEEAEWGTLLRHLPDPSFSVKVLAGAGTDEFLGLPLWRAETRPSGYVLRLGVDLGETPGFALDWGWIDRDDWAQIGERVLVPKAVVRGKTVRLG